VHDIIKSAITIAVLLANLALAMNAINRRSIPQAVRRPHTATNPVMRRRRR